MKYDVIVIGGGPSGLMAATAAGESGASVLLVDKGERLGRKLAISGGGRCNVTNAKNIDELIRHIPGNGRFLYSALNQFGNNDIIRFFEGMGIALKEEDNGRMFPISDKAKTVVDALLRRVRACGVEIRTNSPVEAVRYQAGVACGIKLQSGEKLDARSVIVATGGKSVPQTGSTGDGYPWAKAAGHTITELYPTEVPLTSGDRFISERRLQGLSLRDVELTIWNSKGKKVISHPGDMIFTHFGLSGPAALRCSQFVVKELQKRKKEREKEGDKAQGAKPKMVVKLTIDLKPEDKQGAVKEQMDLMLAQEPRKTVRNIFKSYVPERLLDLMLERCGIPEDTTAAHMPKEPWLQLCEMVKAFPVAINGTLSLSEAFVTGGGVHLKEIDPKTMGSKMTSGLFFCGEILDIHGYTGGYNITAAFTTGHHAGFHAAAYARLLQ